VYSQAGCGHCLRTWRFCHTSCGTRPLSALIAGLALLLTMTLARSSNFMDWIICGTTWGVAALVNPALLTPLPVLALWLLDRGRKWRQVFVMATFTIVVILPWTIRNYIPFHEIMPIRSNALTEVYFANCGFGTHPLGPSMEYRILAKPPLLRRQVVGPWNISALIPRLSLMALFGERCGSGFIRSTFGQSRF
jgi:hypothetical protein